MAQTYKMMLGTSGKQWELLTVREDGRMTMTFHGTDREICHEVTDNADGWLCYPGAMYPGLESGKWQAVDEQAAVVTPAVQCAERFCREDIPQPTPRPKRQRKPRTNNCETITNNRGTTITNNRETSSIIHQPSATLKAVGMVAAATVALFVIYETGLLIPLGLIGLATSGFLK